MNNHIAIIFDDLTEFFVMRPVIDELLKNKIPTDIIVPYDSGYNGLSEHTLTKIKEFGYHPISDAPKNKIYKVLLTPYPGLEIVKRLKYIYHVQYPYAVAISKPDPVYYPDVKLEYDALIFFNNVDAKYLEPYGTEIRITPFWRYHNFKHIANKSSKPVLLILPTFGSDISCIDQLTEKSIQDIKKHFKVITKAHHATHFGVDGRKALDKLKLIADEFYNSDCPIDDLLKRADIVLSDNSGAIFDSICAEIPVVLFAKDLNSRHLQNINTLQYELAQKDIIPHTDNPDKILSLLLNIKPYIKKQQKIKKEIFPPDTKNPVKDCSAIIKEYLNRNEDEDYHKTIHDILIKEWRDNKQEIQLLKQENSNLSKQINILQNSVSWKVTKPLRTIKNRMKNVKR